MMESTKIDLLRRVACFLLVMLCAGPALADESKFPLLPAPVEDSSAVPTSPISPSKVIGSLAVVLGGFLLVTLLFPKQKRRREQNDLVQLIGEVAVTPKIKLHLVRLGDRLLVLHVTGNSVQRLAEITDAEEVRRLFGDEHASLPTEAPPVDQLLKAVEADGVLGRRLVA